MKAERISFLLIASSGAGRCLFSTFRTESCVTRPSPLHFLLLAVKSPSCNPARGAEEAEDATTLYTLIQETTATGIPE